MQNLQDCWQFGDHVIRKDSKHSYHYGVYLGRPPSNADIEVVFDLTKDPESDRAICRFISLDEFAAGKPYELRKPIEKSDPNTIKDDATTQL